MTRALAPASPATSPMTAAGPSRLRRRLHWLIAAGVLILVTIGLVMTRIGGTDPAALARRGMLYSAHKSLGLVVFALALWRLGLLVRAGLLTAPRPGWEVMASRCVAGLFLASLVLMPLTGLAQHGFVRGAAPIWGLPELALLPADPGASARFGAAHRALAWLTIGALLLHVAGAFKHHWIDRDGTLRRMVAGGGMPNPAPVPGARVSAWIGALAVVGLALAAFLPADSSPAGPTAAGGGWVIDKAASRLDIAATAMGAEISARFERFDARIVLDPEDLGAAVIEAVVDTASFVSGLPDRDAIVREADWLDAARFPLARFLSHRVARQADGLYEAPGGLRIRETEIPVTLQFRLDIEGNEARARGSFRFDRFVAALGRGPMGGEDVAGREVTLNLDIRAHRATPSRGPGS